MLPLVLFAARRVVLRHPVRAAAVALLGAVASTIWMGVLFSPASDPSRAYLGSDSHAMGLLVGVALGVLAGAGRPAEIVRPSRPARPCSPRARASWRSLVIMRVADADTAALYRGGFLVFAVLCAIVLVVVVTMPDTALAARAAHARARRDRAPFVLVVPLALARTRVPDDELRSRRVRAVRGAARGVGGARRDLVPVHRAALPARAASPARGGAGLRSRTSWCSHSSRACSSSPSPRPRRCRRRDLAHLGAINGNTDPNALRVDTFGDSTALGVRARGRAARAGARHHGGRRRRARLWGRAGRPRDRDARHREPGRSARAWKARWKNGAAQRSARAPRAHDGRVGDPRPEDERRRGAFRYVGMDRPGHRLTADRALGADLRRPHGVRVRGAVLRRRRRELLRTPSAATRSGSRR